MKGIHKYLIALAWAAMALVFWGAVAAYLWRGYPELSAFELVFCTVAGIVTMAASEAPLKP